VRDFGRRLVRRFGLAFDEHCKQLIEKRREWERERVGKREREREKVGGGEREEESWRDRERKETVLSEFEEKESCI
jgi:hypothetical protein